MFAEELQHRIATAEEHVELFYPLEDIRVLLGGLAMSQLHVFQGISGTGKTSLAKAFAKAMGASVQTLLCRRAGVIAMICWAITTLLSGALREGLPAGSVQSSDATLGGHL